MKSSPESVTVWNPPELGIVPTAKQSSDQKAQALTIFRSEDVDGASLSGSESESKPAAHFKGVGKTFSTWNPGFLNDQAEAVHKDEWTFLEVYEPAIAALRVPTVQRNVSERTAQHEILRANENQASLILEKARRQAEEIILSAQSVADDSLFQAQSEIDEQKKQGYEQGRIEARAELDQTLSAARKMSEEVQAWKDGLISQGEEILVDMLKEISRKMFGEGVKLEPEALHVHLNQVMENARGLGVLKIFLNPNDARLLDPSWGEQQMLSLGEQVKIIPSGNITRGGCLIKGNIGTVDGRVETQLESILKTFEETGQSAG